MHFFEKLAGYWSVENGNPKPSSYIRVLMIHWVNHMSQSHAISSANQISERHDPALIYGRCIYEGAVPMPPYYSESAAPHLVRLVPLENG